MALAWILRPLRRRSGPSSVLLVSPRARGSCDACERSTSAEMNNTPDNLRCIRHLHPPREADPDRVVSSRLLGVMSCPSLIHRPSPSTRYPRRFRVQVPVTPPAFSRRILEIRSSPLRPRMVSGRDAQLALTFGRLQVILCFRLRTPPIR
nr:MAG: hypothetical protein [Leviviridae sp.]